MNTGQLECFLAVADHLNYARAAEYLHITQPAVTHQINSLEAELGRPLFKRTTRSVSLTIDGFRFLPDAKKVLDDMRIAEIRFKHQDTSEIKPFVIGCNNSVELVFLPALLSRLKAAFPSLHPCVRILSFRAVEHMIQNENLDVLFGFQSTQSRNLAGQFRVLTCAPIVCVFQKEHPLSVSGRKFLRLTDIEKEPLVVLEPPKALPEILDIQNKIVPNRRPMDIYPCDSTDMALTLVRAGLGMTLLPDIIPMRDPSLSYIPVEDAPQAKYGIFYKTVKDRPLVKRFLSEAQDYFQTVNAPGL